MGRALVVVVSLILVAGPSWAEDARLVFDFNEEGRGASGRIHSLGDGEFLFGGFDPESGHGLWKSDGTLLGTTQLVDPNEDGLSGSVNRFVDLGDLVLFRSTKSLASSQRVYGLWVTDSTTDGTELLAEFRVMFPPRVIDDIAYLMAATEEDGFELWKTDGTVDGTELVADIVDGEGDGARWPLVPFEGEVYFAGFEEDTGWELWKSDGTEGGTALVSDLTVGEESSSIQSVVEFDGQLFVTTESGELYVTDGTDDGTELVAEDLPHQMLATSESLILLGENGYLEEYEVELWISDGTTDGTEELVDLVSGSTAQVPALHLVYEDRVYFSAGSDSQVGVWASDGTEDGTEFILEHPVNTFYQARPYLATAGDRLFICIDHEELGLEAWVSDGTPDGTLLIDDLASGEASSTPSGFVDVDDVIYFTAVTDSYGRELLTLEEDRGFLRGDVDSNGVVQPLLDAIHLARAEFLGAGDIPCARAADVDGDGEFDPPRDFWRLLQWAFEGGFEPPDPGPFECGLEETVVSCVVPADACD